MQKDKIERNKHGGFKFDNGKRDWTLLPFEEIEEVVKVLEFGAQKYEPDNWKKVEKDRYRKSAFRHLIAYQKGGNEGPRN